MISSEGRVMKQVFAFIYLSLSIKSHEIFLYDAISEVVYLAIRETICAWPAAGRGTPGFLGGELCRARRRQAGPCRRGRIPANPAAPNPAEPGLLRRGGKLSN